MMVVSAVDARVACGEPPFPVSGFCFPFSEMISKGQVWIVEVDKMRSDGVFPYVFFPIGESGNSLWPVEVRSGLKIG